MVDSTPIHINMFDEDGSFEMTMLEGDSGYSSDQEDNDGPTSTESSSQSINCESIEDDCSVLLQDHESSSPDISDGDDCSDSDDDDTINKRLAFLTEKRHLLQRASYIMKEEELYDASVARCGDTTHANPAPIWAEAKEVMALLKRRNTGGYVPRPRGKMVSFAPQSWQKARQVRSSMKRTSTGRQSKINLGTVKRISAKEYQVSSSVASKYPAVHLEDGNWVVKAMQSMNHYNSISTASPPGRRINATADSMKTLPIDSLFPSPRPSKPSGMSMEEALTITNVPQ